MRLVLGTCGIAILLAAGSVAAQQPAEPPPQSGPIVGGKDIQPRPAEPPSNATSTDAQKLLDEYKPASPSPPPHDIYGRPLDSKPDAAKPQKPPS
ncbi:MAG TPA: hypothetical protein VKS60_19630 [Stellaceae bacterium]|nr:hypothetical protein [Stellaceae bacterium]